MQDLLEYEADAVDMGISSTTGAGAVGSMRPWGQDNWQSCIAMQDLVTDKHGAGGLAGQQPELNRNEPDSL